MCKKVAFLIALFAWPALASAQQVLIPSQYRVTRSSTGTPVTVTFTRLAMTCAVPPGSALNLGVEIDDPASTTTPKQKCHYPVGDAAWTNLTPGVAYTFTIAGAGTDNVFGPESAPVVVQRQGAPGGLRIAPTWTGVQAEGTIRQRFPMAGLDVAEAALDGSGALVYLGASTLTAGLFDVKVGDRISVAFWR